MKLNFEFGWNEEVEAYVLRIRGNQVVLVERELLELLEAMEKAVRAKDTE
jgi:hypothetical protein